MTTAHTGLNHIHFQDVSKSYGQRAQRTPVLGRLSGTIQNGSFTSIIGRSGSGKSTLLRLLAGLMESDTGRISIGASNTERLQGEGVRYIFQNYGDSLLPWKTVKQNIDFGIRHATHARHSNQPELPAEHYLRLVNLEGIGNKYPWELSGGMQQRIAIARALASSPGVVLMDEPFGAVDALSRVKLQDMILNLWAELGITIILVTHDIDEAIYLSDRVLVLRADGHGFADDISIDLPRPRSQLETRDHPSFNHYRKHLYDLVLL